ncbi:MAG TPA: RICIN domain-containing protein, partial [Lentzea sp.]
MLLALTGSVLPADAAPASALSGQSAVDMGTMSWYFNRPLKNVNSGKCALVRGTDNEAPAVQFQCADYPDQRWNLLDTLNNEKYQIVNRNSGKCLLVRGTDNEAPAVQTECADYADQLWR